MKKIILLFFTCNLLLYATTIKEAWDFLKSNDNALKAKNIEQKIAKLKQKSAKSMYLPSISLTGSYSYLDEPVKIAKDSLSLNLGKLGTIPLPTHDIALSEQNILMANVNLVWPLYTGGKIDAAQDIYKAKTKEAKILTEIKKDKKFLKLIKYYYGVVVSKSLFNTRKEAYKALSLHYENAKKLMQNGQIANVELLNAKVKLDAAKIELTKAKNKFLIAQSALKTLIKKDIEPTSSLFVKNKIKKSQSSFKTEMEQNYSGLEIFDVKDMQAKAFEDIKKAAWYPEVVGFANYNLYKDNSILSQSLPTWFGGVMVKIDILKRSDRNQEIQIAKMMNQKVNRLRLDALESLHLLLEKTYKELMASKEEYNSLTSSIDLANENYKLRTIAFKEGLTTSVELVEAQTFLESVKTKRLNAAYLYLQKLALLCVLSGERNRFFEFVEEKDINK